MFTNFLGGNNWVRFLFSVIILVITPNFEYICQQRNYFYTNKKYGSEALFNPISLLLNGAYDVTQLQSVTNNIHDPEFSKKAKVVFRNLSHPIESIRNYGTEKFLKGEFLPLSWEKGNMQWIPNYQNHLIGGGMLYTAMKEWYREHNFPEPWIWSAATLMTQHLLNEIYESGAHEGWSVDEVSDIYIFDLGGIILFSFDSVNEFFSETLNYSDWSLQATVTAPHGRVHAGQYFSLKWKLPFSEDYSLFYRYGMGGVAGLSKAINEEDNLSVGIGFRTKHLIDVGPYRQRTIETGWQVGFFYDRNNSLMTSVIFSGIKEYFCTIDVYPGILMIGDFSPGLWTVIGRNGNTMIGLSTRYVLSIGYEFGAN
ncbi:MAG: hypothetical protein HXY50_14215 [Ignavibacteriaceae bacterium]|nr:hypothetical protein [Ignavibacteriaceae bacterium]